MTRRETAFETDEPASLKAEAAAGTAASAQALLPVKGSEATDVSLRGRTTALDRWLIRRLLMQLGRPPIQVRLWDGYQICLAQGDTAATVLIHDRPSLLRLLWQPSIGFAEGYRRGRIDVQGRMVDLCGAAELTNGTAKTRSWNGLRGLGRRRSCSVRQASRNIHAHYDLGNDFYRLWLDEKLIYSCAWFSHPSVSLETAQIDKLDLICQKLDLRPGQEVIEAGCGWGALALHMAAHYRVRVQAFNISRQQLLYARQAAADSDLSDRVTFIEQDWRDITGRCDRFVSVGMLEHVGPENFRQLSDVIHRVLKPSGMGLIHSIGRNVACPLDGWIQRDIFPGAEPPSLRQMADIFEPHGFSVLDVENLRLHYAWTLEHWLERFEAQVDRVREMFDEEFVRLWRLYLASSIYAFDYGGLQLFQVVFSHGRNNAIPWTRTGVKSRVTQQ